MTQGALRYLFQTQGQTNFGKVNGANEAYGIMSDCVYAVTNVAVGTPAGQTGCQLTSAWGFNAGYEHYWTPAWHTSLYGAWYEVKYGNVANGLLCSNQGFGTLVGGSGGVFTAAAGCNNNWSTWGVGSRTQWDVTKTFYLGVEVLYSQMRSAQTPTGALPADVTIAGTGATAIQNQASNWAVAIRAHRDFLP